MALVEVCCLLLSTLLLVDISFVVAVLLAIAVLMEGAIDGRIDGD